MIAVFKKELRAFFDSPAAYVATVVMLLIAGYLFAQPLFLINQASISGFADNAQFLLIFFVPAVTMRLYAEERRAGTIEILSTLPVSDLEVLWAKFLAAVALLTFILAGTWVFPATLGLLGRPDWGAVAGCYAGLWLDSAALAAIGLWASALTRNQITAFITAFLIGFALFLAGKITLFMPPALAPLLGFLGFDAHVETLSRGVVDTRDLAYFASLTGFFLHLAYLRVSLQRVRP
jgi:ABC-2 type transport system permease protein